MVEKALLKYNRALSQQAQFRSSGRWEERQLYCIPKTDFQSVPGQQREKHLLFEGIAQK